MRIFVSTKNYPCRTNKDFPGSTGPGIQSDPGVLGSRITSIQLPGVQGAEGPGVWRSRDPGIQGFKDSGFEVQGSRDQRILHV